MASYLQYISSHYTRQILTEIPNYCNRNIRNSMKMGIFGRICGNALFTELEPPNRSFCDLWRGGKDKYLCKIWKGKNYFTDGFWFVEDICGIIFVLVLNIG